jgi:hypothetical protein
VSPTDEPRRVRLPVSHRLRVKSVVYGRRVVGRERESGLTAAPSATHNLTLSGPEPQPARLGLLRVLVKTNLTTHTIDRTSPPTGQCLLPASNGNTCSSSRCETTRRQYKHGPSPSPVDVRLFDFIRHSRRPCTSIQFPTSTQTSHRNHAGDGRRQGHYCGLQGSRPVVTAMGLTRPDQQQLGD